jgi:hypothetical protein
VELHANVELYINVELHANVELYINVGLCGAATSNGPLKLYIRFIAKD